MHLRRYWAYTRNSENTQFGRIILLRPNIDVKTCQLQKMHYSLQKMQDNCPSKISWGISGARLRIFTMVFNSGYKSQVRMFVSF